MTTTPRRKRTTTPARPIEDTAQEYFYYRGEISTQGKIKEARADKLRKHVRANGTPVDPAAPFSTLQYLFPKPMQVGNYRFLGLELRYKQPVPEFDEEAALDLIKERGLLRQCTKMVRVVDQEALYVALQQKKVTEEEMDSLLINPEDDEEYKPQYALWPIDAEPEAV